MKIGTSLVGLIAAFAMGSASMAPLNVEAQSHRQQQKNQWRNLSIGSGALGLLGLVKGNGTLATLGVAGAAYSAYRYEQDRKSQSKSDRDRAAMYGRRSFTKDGHRYVRHTKYVKHKKYYYFKRES